MKGIPEASGLAIVEKRTTHRPGGCVGIFVQLLDWNRRLAKKKLFYKKLLPPVRAVKRISKKFGANDKMPMSKMLLIADENRGGFPVSKKPEKEVTRSSSDDVGNGMRTPGLVARLMGLELMPDVGNEKPRKALDSEFCCDRDEGSRDYSRLDQDLCKDTGPSMCKDTGASMKLDSRPQKLQRTAEFVERRLANADHFSTGVFQLSRSVRSASRQQHHKLPTPVKSPRLLSRRNTARLMEAATKLLEPGLQSRNRLRYALTYMGSSRSEDDGHVASSSAEEHKESVVGSCKNCGSLVEMSEVNLGGKEPLTTKCSSSVLDMRNASSSNDGSERSKMQSSMTAAIPSRAESLAVQSKVTAKSRAFVCIERKNSVPRDQHQSKPRHNGSLKPTPKLNDSRQNQLLLARDKMVPRSKESSRQQYRRASDNLNEGKDFVRTNRSLTSHNHKRSLDRVPAGHTVKSERNMSEKNMARKRRPITASQMDSIGAINTTLANPRSARSCLISRKGTELSSGHSINCRQVRGEVEAKTVGVKCTDKKDNDIISFTFSSPVKHGSSSLAPEAIGKKFSSKAKSTCGASDVKSESMSFSREKMLEGDTLSKLLEQKIRELTSLEQIELEGNDTLPGRSNAAILEELVSAFTFGSSISEKGTASCSGISALRNQPFYFSESALSLQKMLPTNIKSEEEPETCISTSFVACENDQPSPISILEASFSNDSSFSESLNGSSGCKLPFELAKSFGNKVDLDVDLLDSATSVTLRRSIAENSRCFMDNISSIQGSHTREVEFVQHTIIKLGKEFSNVELLFGQISVYESDGECYSRTESILLDMLEDLIEASNSSSDCNLGFKEAEGNHLRTFLLDCMMECLDLKYGQFFKSGYRTWSRLPSFFTRESLTRGVHEEIKASIDLAGRSMDELMEKELSSSTLIWKEFKVEAFETGTEIGIEILQILVDEIVADLTI